MTGAVHRAHGSYATLRVAVLLVVLGYLVVMASPLHMPGMQLEQSSASQAQMGSMDVGVSLVPQVAERPTDCFSRCLLELNGPPTGRWLNLLAGLLSSSWLPVPLGELSTTAQLAQAVESPPPINLQSLLQTFRF